MCWWVIAAQSMDFITDAAEFNRDIGDGGRECCGCGDERKLFLQQRKLLDGSAKCNDVSRRNATRRCPAADASDVLDATNRFNEVASCSVVCYQCSNNVMSSFDTRAIRQWPAQPVTQQSPAHRRDTAFQGIEERTINAPSSHGPLDFEVPQGARIYSQQCGQVSKHRRLHMRESCVVSGHGVEQEPEESTSGSDCIVVLAEPPTVERANAPV
jgi:hypothetical protein